MTEENGADRAAGAALLIAAAGTMLAMAHHPVGAHSGGLGGIVHGAMIGLLMLLAWGFLQFVLRRGAARPLILGGLLAYAVSLFAHIGAATINGFVVPGLINPEAPISHDIFRLAWHSNQALAKLGVVMTGLAYLLWSADLLARGPKAARLVGAAGVVAGLVPVVLLAGGVIRMDVAGAFLVYAMHAAWAALIGVLMIRGLVSPSQARGNPATSS